MLSLAWVCATVACADLNPFQAPYLILDHEGGSVVTDSTHVYWGTYEGIRAVEKTDESDSYLLVRFSEEEQIRELVADDNNLYWLTDTYSGDRGDAPLILRRASKSGTAKTPFDYDTADLEPCLPDTSEVGGLPPQNLALDRNHVYFAARPSNSDDFACEAYRVPTTGNSPATSIGAPVPPAGASVNARALAADESAVYWVVSIEGQDGTGRLYKKGTNPESPSFDPVCDVDKSTSRMIIDDTNVWLATRNGILRVEKETGDPVDLVEGKKSGGTAAALAVDDTDVYWVVVGWSMSHGGEATLYRTGKDAGGNTTQMVSFVLDAPNTDNPPYTWAISVSDGWVYSAVSLEESFGGPDGIFKIHN
ncbi:MAG: hypothetical protein A2289_26395 [Deltaproteobacteria bacterium RIFOXYA12_FULL_58_15]|nr:MAG: hypothetical protein A2289_26395 [Deltaproteobacteria bacterium RIFOXYA12_FULL_58_15]